MINRTKTEATCSSVSPKREEFILQINEQEIHQQDTTTYFGAKLGRTLSWSPYISTMHSKVLMKMAMMKKLAGRKWAANIKILTKVYTATVRPHMDCVSRYEDHSHLRSGKDSGPAVFRRKERGKTPAPK